MDLKDLRKQIDKIDDEILRLFKDRMNVSMHIAQYKKEQGLPVFDPAREQEKLYNKSPYEQKLFSTLFELSRDCQDKILSAGNQLLIINGPNLNMLGIRELELYGNKTYADLVVFIQQVCKQEGIEWKCIQSNHEGEIVDVIQSAHGKYVGIVINPAAYTHTSIAILDALKTVNIPSVEVHLTDIQNREDFRKVSYVSEACEKTFAGLGFDGYAEAIKYLAGKTNG